VKSRDGSYTGEIIGTPAADSKFAKLLIGMETIEVQKIVGRFPDEVHSYESGKRWISASSTVCTSSHVGLDAKADVRSCNRASWFRRRAALRRQQTAAAGPAVKVTARRDILTLSTPLTRARTTRDATSV